jgi:hypothetical protein
VAGDAKALDALAPRYRNDALGEHRGDPQGRQGVVRCRRVSARKSRPCRSPTAAWPSSPSTRRRPASMLVRADKDGVRKLVVRDGQHEYVFDEVK